MSKSKSTLSITERLLLDFIKFKTNRNFKFFMNNEKIALALDLTPNSAKVMVNKLAREGYLIKEQDNHGRRVLSLSGKAYTPLFIDLRNVEKKLILLELANYQRDAEYYKQQYELEKARADRLAEDVASINLKNIIK